MNKLIKNKTSNTEGAVSTIALRGLGLMAVNTAIRFSG